MILKMVNEDGLLDGRDVLNYFKLTILNMLLMLEFLAYRFTHDEVMDIPKEMMKL